MVLKEKLQVRLLPGWIDYSSKNPEGPPTFVKTGTNTINPLQISYAIYDGGKVPNPTIDDLLKMCKDFGVKNRLGKCNSTNFGQCLFGIYATAIYETKDFPWFQLWYISNGKDFIFITYICESIPSKDEQLEAFEIALDTSLKFE